MNIIRRAIKWKTENNVLLSYSKIKISIMGEYRDYDIEQLKQKKFFIESQIGEQDRLYDNGKSIMLCLSAFLLGYFAKTQNLRSIFIASLGVEMIFMIFFMFWGKNYRRKLRLELMTINELLSAGNKKSEE
jgi:hypothetical protein